MEKNLQNMAQIESMNKTTDLSLITINVSRLCS